MATPHPTEDELCSDIQLRMFLRSRTSADVDRERYGRLSPVERRLLAGALDDEDPVPL